MSEKQKGPARTGMQLFIEAGARIEVLKRLTSSKDWQQPIPPSSVFNGSTTVISEVIITYRSDEKGGRSSPQQVLVRGVPVVFTNRRRLIPTRRRPGLQRLTHLADFFGLGLRKRIKAMVGDFDAEIGRLHRQRRYKAAKWNQLLAWGYAGWYVIRGPVDWVRELLMHALTGK